MNPRWKVDTKRFEAILQRLLKRSDDWRPLFHTIGKNFRQSRKSIFALDSAGGYKDLSPRYKKLKADLWGFEYPILRASGLMEKSIVEEDDPDNISIVERRSFAFGSKDPILKFHNSDKKPRKKMPLRKVIFFGPEAPSTMPKESQTFYDRTKQQMLKYLIKEKGQ